MLRQGFNMKTINRFVVFLAATAAFMLLQFSFAGSLTATPTSPYFTPGNIIDFGQNAIANTVISGGIGPYSGNWMWSTGSPLTVSNALLVTLPTNNAMTLTINSISLDSLELTFGGSSFFANTIGSHTILGTWTFSATANDANGNVLMPPITNTFVINPALSAGIQLPPNTPPLVEPTQAFTLIASPNDTHANSGSSPYTYNWFVGDTMGYDRLTFSLMPPTMPTPPPPNTLPTPMFEYQNPGNFVAPTPYTWNAIGFNALTPGNVLAIARGNASALPAFLPNVFTVQSTLSNAFTVNVPVGYPVPSNAPGNVISQLQYDLDTYQLAQYATFNSVALYSSSNMANAIAANEVGLTIELSNPSADNGVSGNYLNAYTPPLFIMVTGYRVSKGGVPKQSQAFYSFNSLPASSANVVESIPPFPGAKPFQLFTNVTSVSIMGPLPPSPGINVSIYDSVNTMYQVSNNALSADPSNNLLLASYTYNGPFLYYNSANQIYKTAIPASAANVVTYSGESGNMLQLNLIANSLITSPPSVSTPYFTYNVPEAGVGNTVIQIYNSSMMGGYPLYSFSNTMSFPTNVLFQPAAGPSQELSLSPSGTAFTPRGSVIGPTMPTFLTYFVANVPMTFGSNVIGGQASTISNTILEADNALGVGPNLIKLSETDSASSPETSNFIMPIIVAPPISAATVSVTNNTIGVGQTTLITIHLAGGTPPYQGIWNIVPPGVSTTANSAMPLMLPVNEITLLANVISANTIIFTPTMGSNSSVAGGRNNSMVLYITDNNAYLQLPKLNGGSSTALLVATGLKNNTIYGLWGAQANVSTQGDPAKGLVGFNVSTGGIAGGPVPSYSRLPYGGTVTLTANPSGGTAPYVYQWYSGASSTCSADTAISGATSSTYVTGSADYYCYLIKDSSGTTDYSTAAYVTVESAPSSGGGVISTGTTVSTTATTTIIPATTTISIRSTSSNTVVLSKSNGYNQSVNFTNYNLSLEVMSNSSTPSNVVVSVVNSTLTAPPAPQGYATVAAFNITARNTTLLVTLHYNCILPSFRIAPYMYSNGAWVAITPFTVNATSCTVAFSIPGDPLVSVFEAPTPAPTTTLPTTSIVSTTVPATTTTAPAQQPSKPNNDAIYAVIVAIIIIVIIAVLLYRQKAFGKKR